jgi:hypothetical protein
MFLLIATLRLFTASRLHRRSDWFVKLNYIEVGHYSEWEWMICLTRLCTDYFSFTNNPSVWNFLKLIYVLGICQIPYGIWDWVWLFSMCCDVFYFMLCDMVVNQIEATQWNKKIRSRFILLLLVFICFRVE